METFVYGMAAGLAGVLKILLLMQVITRTRIASAFNLVVIALILQHCFEFLALMSLGTDFEFSGLMVHGVLLAAYMICASMVNLVLTVNPVKHHEKIRLSFMIAALLLAMLQLAGLVVSGFVRNSYTIVSLPGPLYFLVQVLVLSTILVTLAGLANGVKSKDRIVQMRSRFTLKAIAPMAAVSFAIVAGRILEIETSSAIAMPIASTIFVWLLMYDEKGDIVQFSLDWAVFWLRIRMAFSEKFFGEKLSPADFVEKMERFQLSYTMKATGYNIKQTAELTRMPWSTVKDKCNRYGIYRPEKPEQVAAIRAGN